MKLHPATIFMISIFFISCLGGHKHDPILTEAFEIHNQSLTISKEARNALDKIADSDSIKLHLASRLAQWNENIVEVPGFEHHHDHNHDHGHHHHNHSTLELLPTDMLRVQKEFLDSIRVIHTEIQTLSNNLSKE